jgi:hypothetical protein
LARRAVWRDWRAARLVCSEDKPGFEGVMTGAGVAVFGVVGPVMDVEGGGFRGVLIGDLKGLERALEVGVVEEEEEIPRRRRLGRGVEDILVCG